MGSGNAVMRGAWAVGTTYAIDDVVDFNGGRYRAVAISTGVYPGSDATSWHEFAAENDSADQPGGQAADSLARNVVISAGSAYTAKVGDIVVATTTQAIAPPPLAGLQPGDKFEVVSNGASITATITPVSPTTVNGTTAVTVTTQYTKKSFLWTGAEWIAS